MLVLSFYVDIVIVVVVALSLLVRILRVGWPIHFPPVLFFFSEVEISSHTNSTLRDRIIPQWLSKLR